MTSAPSLSPGRRRALTVVVLLLAGTAATITASATAAPATAAAPASASALRFAVNRPLCARPARPTDFGCFAMARVEVARGTRGAYAFDAVGHGVRGGYTPGDLAKAYRYNPFASVSQTVAVVDWYDDPKALADLNVFDHKYGLPSETTRTFGKVNQSGHAAPLPNGSARNNHSAAPEIALDIEAVRAACHKCRILLVEADRPTAADLAAAENTAVRLGADEISNSFGGPESIATASMVRAFNHAGVVITASTGDDGWYGWDGWNFVQSRFDTVGEASFPAAAASVVAVGGTSLRVNADGSRATERVWNRNGADDRDGFLGSNANGATGGGCSNRFAARGWQGQVAAYASAGCSGGRLAADIAAVGDPRTGLDVFDSYDFGRNRFKGWVTIGGTSLSSPVAAALFALAGGSGGSAYPAASLYVNSSLHPSTGFDVTSGGNGFCGGNTTPHCSDAALSYSFGTTNNPNAIPASSLLDCSYPTHGDVLVFPARNRECNAAVGFDGPTGLGTPNGLGLFRATSASVGLQLPAELRLNTAAQFTAHVTEHVAGAHPTSYQWRWGDGHAVTTKTATVQHTYVRAGRYTVSLTVYDSLHQVVVRTRTVAVGLTPVLRFAGSTTPTVGRSTFYTARGTTDPNTGGSIRKITWRWGDGTATTGTSAAHTYHHVGTYRITLSAVDNAGIRASLQRQVTVTR